MKFALHAADIMKSSADCWVVGIFEKSQLSPMAERINTISKGYLTKLLKNEEFQGKVGQTLMLYHVPHLPIPRLLLVGCGKEAPLSEKNYHKIMTHGFHSVRATKATRALFLTTDLLIKNRHTAWRMKYAVETIHDALYRFDTFKKEKEPASSLKEIVFAVTKSSEVAACQLALKESVAIAKGVEWTKNLANLPSNVCTPTYLAQQAKQLTKEYSSISMTLLQEKDMQKLGMGAFLAVAQGSTQEAKLICLHYKGTSKKQAPVALVGKGVTFDTGGISLKTQDGMIGMKYDMCGAATVLGTLKAAAELKLPLHLVGVIAATENMPSGSACKPEDIVTSLSGQTIEIMNTDAEGRLILSDALTYCERYKPEVVIDIATLTGAVVIALGHHATGLLTNHEPLANDLIAAGLESHDRVWQLPLWEDYQEQLKSPFADMSNVGGRSAGAITAACFLSRFAKKFHWAHLDVAGTAAMMGGGERAATGRPVPLLMQYLINRCKR